MDKIFKELKTIQSSLPKRSLLEQSAFLQEECGELAVEILIKEGLKNREPGIDGILGESIDAIICLLDIVLTEFPNITEEDLKYFISKKLNKWKDNINV